MTDQIRQAINDHARLPVPVDTLSDDADLYSAGMTSHASVNVMLALEDAFDIEFPIGCSSGAFSRASRRSVPR
ncbi:MAG: acyl carrier protein [Solirubrobacterales bacterium]|nr:acyl carrier protein [Solirubrobacterales bacterium]